MVLSVTLNPCVDHAVFLDQLHWGDTNRISRVERDAGGKGLNVSRIYAALGGQTAATGFLGGQPAPFIREILQKESVQDAFVDIKGTTRTNISIEDLSGNPPTTLNEKGPTIEFDEFNELIERITELSSNTTWVTFGGSVPPGLPADTYGEVFKAVQGRFVLDADGEALAIGIKHQPHFVKPNAAEASKLLSRPIESDAHALEAVEELYDLIGGGNRFAVISRGKEGAVVCGPGREVLLGRSPKITPKSTVGSGDSLIGGMLWAIDQGKPLSECLKWGLCSGAATATSDGTRIGDRETIYRLFGSL
jgi:1-phosphofructokinase